MALMFAVQLKIQKMYTELVVTLESLFTFNFSFSIEANTIVHQIAHFLHVLNNRISPNKNVYLIPQKLYFFLCAVFPLPLHLICKREGKTVQLKEECSLTWMKLESFVPVKLCHWYTMSLCICSIPARNKKDYSSQRQ